MMNNFTRKEKQLEKMAKHDVPAVKPWMFYFMVNCGIMFAMIFTAFAIRIHLNEKTENLERSARDLALRTEQVKREISNLIAQKEHMQSMAYIDRKIREYKLALRPTSASQLRYLKYYDYVPAGQTDAAPRSMADAGKKDSLNYQASVKR